GFSGGGFVGFGLDVDHLAARSFQLDVDRLGARSFQLDVDRLAAVELDLAVGLIDRRLDRLDGLLEGLLGRLLRSGLSGGDLLARLLSGVWARDALGQLPQNSERDARAPAGCLDLDR